MTLREALQEGADALEGTETPFLDATLILAHALDIDRSRVLAGGPESVDEDALARYRQGIDTRSRGVSVAYVVGQKEFWGRTFFVDERVLVPRPDTEILVEAALKLGDTITQENQSTRFATPPPRKLRIHESCCGSLCVAVSLAVDRPAWEVSASDLSEAALAVARVNAAALLPRDRAGGNVTLSHSDLLSSIDSGTGFDMILANPPYVGSEETLALLARGWSEPRMALDGGKDGLDIVRRLVPQAERALSPGGALLVEADGGQADEVADLFRASRFSSVETYLDLGGKARVTSGRKAWTS